MKKSKKAMLVISLLLMAVVCSILLPLEASASEITDSGTCGATYGTLQWTLDEEGTLTISGSGDMKDWSASNYAPWYGKSISSVIIESGVTSVGNHAFFDCTELENVTIPSSVTRIGNAAFSYCTNLTDVDITNGVQNIGDSAFSNCTSLVDITIPGTVTGVGSYAFKNCTGLENVSMSNGVQNIGSNAFYDCSSLTQIVIPESVTIIGNDAFYGCSCLTDVYVTDLTAWLNVSLGNVKSNPMAANSNSKDIYLNDELIEDLVIPSGITSIRANAFCGCSNIINIVIPESVNSIGGYAFSGCSSLITVEVPNTVASIEAGVLEGCTSLEVITLPFLGSDNSGGAFNHIFGGSIPTGIKYVSIASGAISSGSFSNCQNLIYVDLPDNLTSIEAETFYGCHMLKGISIPSGVTNIGERAFYNCKSLVGVSFPESVTSIGSFAFAYCDALNHISYEGTSSQWSDITLGTRSFYTDSNRVKAARHYDAGVGQIGIKGTCISNYVLCDYCDIILYEEAVEGSGHIIENGICTECGMYGTCGDSLVWSLDASGTLTISGSGAMTDWGWCGSPWYSNTAINKVVIKEGVTSIGGNAFADCTSLTSVIISDSVTSIGNSAFISCTGLSNLIIGENSQLTSIGNYALSNCTSLSSITIPNGVINIGDGAFHTCIGLTSIIIPDRVTSIGKSAFEECVGLVSLTMPDSIISVGKDAFKNCIIKNLIIADGSEEVNWNMVVCRNTLENVQIPKSVNVIRVEAFGDCVNLSEIIIPDSVTTIERLAFYHCDSLNTISMPNRVSFVGDMAFYYCDSLTNVTYCGTEEQWNAISIDIANEALTNAPRQYHSYLDDICKFCGANWAAWEYTITNGKVTITGYTGSGTVLTIPGTIENLPVTSIGSSAFFECSELNSVTIPNSVTSIGTGAFYHCTGLTSITIPDSVITIGQQAFDGCTSLNSVTIGNGVASIGKWAFNDCADLTSITIPNNVTSIGSGMFKNCTGLINVMLPNGITTIEDNMFQNCTSLTNVNIPNSVIAIGADAFNGCAQLNDIELPSSITTIGAGAFQNCIALTGITIPGKVTQIGLSAFNGCISLNSVTIGKAVTTIGSWAFQNCTNLSSVTISDSVTSVGADAFSGCNVEELIIAEGSETVTSIMVMCKDTLKKVMIPNSVTTIGANAFYGCVGVTSMVIPDGVLSIGDSAFGDCTELTTIVLGDSVTSIGVEAFKDCTGLTSITIPGSVTSIGGSAFENCDSLTSISIPDGVTSIGAWAFYGCDNLMSVTIPKSVTSIGDYAFSSYSRLRVIFYCGTKEQQSNINIGDFNSELSDTTWHYEVEEMVFAGQNCYYCAECDTCFLFNGDEARATVVFYNWDGTEVLRQSVRYNGTVTIPYAPTRHHEEPHIYQYVFDGWDRDVSIICKDNATYTATFKEEYVDYTVVFEDWNGNVISTQTYHWGDAVAVPANPTKAADNTYTYTFAGWDKTVVNCAGDATYTATYASTYINYTVDFKNWNGDVISTKTYHWGESITIPVDPTKAADNAYTYTFAGWDKKVVNCAGDATYTATYASTYINYTVDFKNWNGDVISTKTYHWGESITIPVDPTKAADNTYTYTFAGWDKMVVNCAGDATYTATYTSNYINYTVVFKNWDGTEISKKTYHFGDLISVPDDPTKASDTTYEYIFAGWDNEIVLHCEGDATYTATYTSQRKDCLLYSIQDGEVTITGYTGSAIELYIPSKIENLPVTKIGQNAFKDCTFSYIWIPESVISIESLAFQNCTGLTEIAVPNSVTSIGYGAFVGCSGLENMTLPFVGDGSGDYPLGWIFGQVIGDISYPGFSKVTQKYVASTTIYSNDFFIPDSLKSVTVTGGDIGYGAFSNCTGITTISMLTSDPEPYIGYGAFSGCSNLESLVLPTAPTDICRIFGSESYSGSYEVLQHTACSDYSGSWKTYYLPRSLKNITITRGQIGECAFDSCYMLENIVLGSEVYAIDAYAFNECTNLKSVHLPKITYCDADAFRNPYGPNGEDDVQDVWYTGTFSDRENIVYNTYGNKAWFLRDATWHYSTCIYGHTYSTNCDTTCNSCEWVRSTNKDHIYDNECDTICNACNDTRTISHSYVEGVCEYCGDLATYVVVFTDEDGAELSSNTYHWGEPITIPANPTKSADNTYTYTFAGWDKPVVNCAGNATYTATYTSTYIDYTIVFKNWDGTVLSSNIYHWGDVVTAPENPTKSADNTYTYAFNGWDNTVVYCAGNATYTATFTSTYIDYTVVFKNWNGSVISTKAYHWGDKVTAPADPTKSADNTYTYAFNGWDNTVVNCAGNATYIATFTSNYIDYTVVFKNWNGSVISTKTYHYGTTVTVPANPTRPEDDTYIYTFTGWDKTVVACNGNAVYTAVYSSKTRVPSAITSSTYTISNGTISKISVGTTISTLVGKLNEGSYVKVYNGNQEVAGSVAIGTGMVVKIMDGNTAKASYTIVVTGDTNGDGKITVTDMLAVKAHVLKKSTLTGPAAQAADTSGDNAISITDFIQMKAQILGKSNVEPRSVNASVQRISTASVDTETSAAIVTNTQTTMSSATKTVSTLNNPQIVAIIPDKKSLVTV